MFINKKLIVLSGDTTGYVKIEKLSDKCIAKVKINEAKDALIGIFEGDRLAYLGDCDSVANIDDVDVNATITVVAMEGDRIIAKGSVNGSSLGQSYILREIFNRASKYDNSQKVDTYPQKSHQRQSIVEQNRDVTIAREQVKNDEQKSSISRQDREIIHQETHRLEERIESHDEREECNEASTSEQEVVQETQPTMQASENKFERIERTKEDMPNDVSENAGEEQKPSTDFYNSIKDELDKLFETYQADEELERLIENSKWVRVPTGEEGYYVTGIIYYDGVPQIICYGVPDKDDSNPPPCNSTCRQWLPIVENGRGYWMMYQSAVDGEFVEET
ncbi:MAG: hypothetical protein ACI4M5_06675 [Christensenellales bacterium]